MVGYPVFSHRLSLLEIEESNVCRWWLIYLIVNDDYFLAREIQSPFSDSADASSDVGGLWGMMIHLMSWLLKVEVVIPP
jgi:hypothetical protein